MICEAVIGTARRDDGTTALRTLGSSPPLRLMPTPDGVYIVGAAAAPLNGDRIDLDIYVAPGTELVVRAAAASIAWPGVSPVPSQFTITARVGEGASLQWLPEPLVPVAGSVHRVTADVELAAAAELVWREEVVLGRHDERPGELSSKLSVVREAEPLLRQELAVGDGHNSPAVLSRGRATGSVTIAGSEFDRVGDGFPIVEDDGEAAILELEGGGRQVVAVAADAIGLRRLLDRGTAELLERPASSAGRIARSEHAPLGN